MSGPQDSRVLDVFGPKFYLETGNLQDSDFGPEAFAIKGINNQGANFTLAHHETNYTRLDTGGDLLIQGGELGSNDTPGVKMISHTGNLELDSTQASLTLGASDTITLEADKIVLKAGSIQIGDRAKHGTKSITLSGTKIQVDGKTGNLPIHLKLSWGAGISKIAGNLVDMDTAKAFAKGAATGGLL
tara:strand:+ start:3878 stop:4438 length:561 start_codon:yes stop_codon:yes gene_type:complete